MTHPIDFFTIKSNNLAFLIAMVPLWEKTFNNNEFSSAKHGPFQFSGDRKPNPLRE